MGEMTQEERAAYFKALRDDADPNCYECKGRGYEQFISATRLYCSTTCGCVTQRRLQRENAR